jgi:hypothetical protein
MFVPHGVIVLRDRRRMARWKAQQQVIHDTRSAAIVSLHSDRATRHFDYEEAVRHLVSIGCDEEHVRQGSMDPESLYECTKQIRSIASSDPLAGIHVGNFVGVSLAAFAFAAFEVHEESVVFSIDPNLVHRGIVNPAGKVISLLRHFGLTRNATVMIGYSLEKSVSNDGIAMAGYDPIAAFSDEGACENQMQAMQKIAPGRFDFALLDGNHHGEYFARELEVADRLLKRGGLLLLDDISWQWSDLDEAYGTFAHGRYEEVMRNGRALIARKTL